MDLEQFAQEVSNNYGKCVPFSKKITTKVITYWHPSYNPENDITMADLRNIPQHIPIL